MTSARIAFFTDSFHEINGVALTSRQFESFARRRSLPFFSVHAGPTNHSDTSGSVTVFEIARSNAAFNLERTSELAFDPFLFRHQQRLVQALAAFQPNAIHITGPGDFGMLGARIASKLNVPLVASWHTNVHEYAGRRLEQLLSFLPNCQLKTVSSIAERQTLSGVATFYKLARLLFAPNPELIDLLRQETGKPCFLMQRGVDAERYSPLKRDTGERPLTIGYVGRLSVEKNVRFLVEIERALLASGYKNFRLLIVGSGSEQQWLRDQLRNADFPGVLKGDALARAYANMDIFAFPSETDTFGNVVLESLASGVPAVVTSSGGPKFLVRSGETGFIASDERAFVRCILELAQNPNLLMAMKRSARAYACGMSWERVFENVIDAYHRVLFPEASFGVAS